MADFHQEDTPTTPKDIDNEPKESRPDPIMKIVLPDVEHYFHDYAEGRFHPLDIGDTLDGRFEVVHKLGNGSSATVWLCLDNQKHEWRAIKIICANESDEDCFDLRLAKLLRDSGLRPSDWEACHIALPLEHFWLEGPNGEHLCLVLPLLGPRLEGSRREETQNVKQLAYQAAQGLQLLHHHNICHGDFRPINILLRLRDTKHISKSEMIKLFGNPTREKVQTCSYKHPGPRYPKYIVYPAYLHHLEVIHEVAIIDFGDSFQADKPPRFSVTPLAFAAPEARYGIHFGLANDIWSLACTMVQWRINVSLLGGLLWDKEIDYVANMEGYFVPLPEPYRSEFLKRLETSRKDDVQNQLAGWGKRVGQDGELATLCPTKDYEARKKGNRRLAEETGFSDPICALLAHEQTYWEYAKKPNGDIDYTMGLQEVHSKVPDDEAVLLADLLNETFKYDPKDRLDIDAVLNHDWFKA